MNDKGIAEYEAGWLAACEHKQPEIDALKVRVQRLECGLRDAICYADDCMKLKARFTRLEKVALDLINYADDYNPHTAIKERSERTAALRKTIKESPAEVKADALREFAAKLSNPIHRIVIHSEADRILQEVKDEQPNEITIGSEAARILRKYDDVSGDSLQEAKDDQ